MPVPIHSRRARFRTAFSRAGLLLGLAGLTGATLENVSFGHVHAGPQIVHHHHVYDGPHEHHHEPSHHHEEHHHSDDHEHGHNHGHPSPPAPDPRDRDTPQKAATFSAAPALFQPVAVRLLIVALADPRPVEPPPELPLVVRRAAQPAGPRAPPSSIAGPDFLL